jgi:hypothetical protein
VAHRIASLQIMWLMLTDRVGFLLQPTLFLWAAEVWLIGRFLFRAIRALSVPAI